jgi:SAM-dependent methyltransferase
MKLRARWSPISTEEEREFERHHIALQRDRYIATDVLQRVRTDRGYAEKVSLIEDALKGVGGLVLDVGSNTCGEAEVLSARGYQIIGMDINEIALGISRERVRRFGRSGPEYVAGDAQYIPVQDGAISTVVCYDALHHLPEPRRALEEIHRVLIPGGRLFFYEPYSFNPYRRLSEIRDWMRGTIEKSFGRRQLRALLGACGFELTCLASKVLPPSEWKRPTISQWWWSMRVLYYRVGRLAPQVFGNLTGVATKSGERYIPEVRSVYDILRCPTSGARVVRVRDGFLSTDPETRLLYPTHEGIPVLVRGEGVVLSVDAWQAALPSGEFR